MEVKIKKLDEKAVIPSYAKEGDAGLDLTAVSCEYNPTIDGFIYGTGLAIEIPKGYVGLVFPRSSNRKTDAYLTNHVGVIDSGYRGEIMLTFKNRDSRDVTSSLRGKLVPPMPYNVGDRVGQIIIVQYPIITFKEVDELSTTSRGIGGHGSTGK